jgi:hypothetical protein
MDLTPLVLCIGAVLLVWVGIAALKSAWRGYYVRPGRNDFVQMSWRERERLERSSINSAFWKFLAKLEFYLLLGAALWIWILSNTK